MSESAVTGIKKQQLAERMARLNIRENDLRETFILGGGPGGQKINKTAVCVRLRHEPSDINVKCGFTRSRELNRFMARRLLCERIEHIREEKTSSKQQEIEKVRRQKRRRNRRQRARMLAEKRKQSEKKSRRSPVHSED